MSDRAWNEATFQALPVSVAITSRAKLSNTHLVILLRAWNEARAMAEPGPWLGRVSDGRRQRKIGEAKGLKMAEGGRTSTLGTTENTRKGAAPATP